MTTPDIDYDKYLGVVTPRFKLLEKTEQDDVWAALPGQFQMVLTQLKHCNMFEWGLVCMTKAYIDMQEEAGKKWSHRAPRDEAHDWIKVAKKLLDMHNLAQTVASTVEAVASTALTVDTHGVRLDGLDENFAEQKAINKEVQQNFSFNAREHNALNERLRRTRRQAVPRAVPQLEAHLPAHGRALARQGPRAHERVAGAGVRGRDGEVAPLRAARQEGRAGQGAPRCQVQGLGNGRRREADGVAQRPPRVSLYSSRAAAVSAVIPHLPKSHS